MIQLHMFQKNYIENTLIMVCLLYVFSQNCKFLLLVKLLFLDDVLLLLFYPTPATLIWLLVLKTYYY